MADTKIKSSNLTDLSVTHDKLHTDMNLTSKTVQVATPTADAHPATKGYVDTEVANLIDSAPGTLDTLNELAAAIGDDANFAATVTTGLSNKLPLAGGTMTGVIAGFESTGIDDNAANTSVTILSDGKVGIGIESPVRTLDVDSSTSTDIARFGNDSGTYTLGYTTDLASIDLASSAGLRIRSGSTLALQTTSDGRVGVGEVSPDYRLEVKGLATTNTDIVGFSNSNGVAKHIFGLENVGAGRYSILDGSNNTAVFFSAHDADNSYINAGRFGIGTTNPSSILHVTDGGAGLEVIPQTANDRTTLLSYDRNTSTYQTLDTDSLDVHFNLSGTERMRIDSSGDVGIGTPDAATRLEVYESFSVSSASNRDVLTITAVDNDGGYFYAGLGSGLAFRSGKITNAVKGPAVMGAIYGANSNDESVDNGYLTFHTRGSNTVTEAMRIDESGNVGIGTETPRSALQVVSNTGRNDGGSARFGKRDITGGLFLHSDVSTSSHYNWMITTQDTVNQGFEIIPSSAPGNIEFSTPAFVITGDDRNVGIGTSGPGEKLHVEGSIRASGNIGVTQTDGDYLAKLYQSSADGFLELYTGNATPVSRVKLSSYGDSYIAPSTNSGLGIGTTAPDAKLHVNGGIIAGVADTANSNYYGMLGTRALGSGLGGYGIHYESGFENPIIWGYNAGAPGRHIRFSTMTSGGDRTLGNGLTDRMVIDTNTGYVGIGGNSTVSANLDVRVSRTDTDPLLGLFSQQSSGADARVMIGTIANQSGDPYLKFDAGGSNMIVGEFWKGTTNNELRMGRGERPSDSNFRGIRVDGGGQTFDESGVVGPMFYINRNYANVSGSGASSGTWGTGSFYSDLTSDGDFLNLKDHTASGLQSWLHGSFAPNYQTSTFRQDIRDWGALRIIFVASRTGNSYSTTSVVFNYKRYFYSAGWTDASSSYDTTFDGTDSDRGRRWCVMPWIDYGDFSNGADVPGLGIVMKTSNGVNMRIGACYVQYRYKNASSGV